MTDDARFIETFRLFLERIAQSGPPTTRATPLGDAIEHYLAAPVSDLPIVGEQIAPHRLVDADLALERLAAADPDSRLIGVEGGQQRHHEAFAELLRNPYLNYAPGPVDFVTAPTGPTTTRQVVGFGVRLFRFEGEPVAVLQRAAEPRFGRETASLDVLATRPDVSSALLARVRELMLELSVLRGQVLSFTESQFGHMTAGAEFLPRPRVDAADIVLEPGVLDAVVSHVVGISENAGALSAAGQHLKRGVLLYGPPGTGKTLTVRHLLTRSPGVTAILLTGSSLRFITAATEIARAMQPSIVVLEDIDLVAMDRGMHGGPQPLLFAVLDALDGLEGDADVAFVLTTNRVDVLEPALAQRPGRVDLAIEVPLPDADQRRGLFELYARGLAFSPDALDGAAARAEGVTASFAKELVRRAVLRAAEREVPVADEHLDEALEELLSARDHLTRSLLGGGGAPHEHGHASFGWSADPGSTVSYGGSDEPPQ